MRRKIRFVLPQSVVAITGLAVIRCISNPYSACRVEFNVAREVEQISVSSDKRRDVVAVPLCADAAVGSVDVLRIASPVGDTDPGDGCRMFWINPGRRREARIAPSEAFGLASGSKLGSLLQKSGKVHGCVHSS